MATMITPPNLAGQSDYEIRVQGILDSTWSDWFDGFALTPQPDETTLLVGHVPDQAALHGILGKINDLGLPLLLVKRLGLRSETSARPAA